MGRSASRTRCSTTPPTRPCPSGAGASSTALAGEAIRERRRRGARGDPGDPLRRRAALARDVAVRPPGRRAGAEARGAARGGGLPRVGGRRGALGQGRGRGRARGGHDPARGGRRARRLLRRGAQGLREGTQAGRRRPGRRGRAVPARGPAARGVGERLTGAALLPPRARGARIEALASRPPRSARGSCWPQGATRLHGGKHRQALPLLERAVREAERAGDRATLGPRLLPPRLGPHRPRQPRGAALPRPRAADLRGARRLRQAGPGPDQPRRQRLPRGALGRGARAVRAGAGRRPSGRATRSAPPSTSTTSPRSGSSRGASTRPRSCCARCSRPGAPPGFAFGIGVALRNLGRVEMRRGELDRAGDLLARGRETLVKGGIDGAVCELDAYDAKRLLLDGDPEGAKLLAERVQDDRAPGRRDPVAAGLPRPDHGRGGARGGSRAMPGSSTCARAWSIAERVDAVYDQALGLDVLRRGHGRGGLSRSRRRAVRAARRRRRAQHRRLAQRDRQQPQRGRG